MKNQNADTKRYGTASLLIYSVLMYKLDSFCHESVPFHIELHNEKVKRSNVKKTLKLHLKGIENLHRSPLVELLLYGYLILYFNLDGLRSVLKQREGLVVVNYRFRYRDLVTGCVVRLTRGASCGLGLPSACGCAP